VKFFPDTAVAGEVLNTARQKEASWFSQSPITQTVCPAASAYPKPGTLNTEPLASVEARLTGPHCGPGSGSASVTHTAGGWDYGSVSDLERCGLESSARLCSPGTAGIGRTRDLCSSGPNTGSRPRAASPPTRPAATHASTVRHFDYRVLPSVRRDLLTLLLLI